MKRRKTAKDSQIPELQRRKNMASSHILRSYLIDPVFLSLRGTPFSLPGDNVRNDELLEGRDSLIQNKTFYYKQIVNIFVFTEIIFTICIHHFKNSERTLSQGSLKTHCFSLNLEISPASYTNFSNPHTHL